LENTASPRLILASTSKYRQQLLQRLGLAFGTYAPDLDETPLAQESPIDTARRLAQLKAAAARSRHPLSLIIGSDQVAECAGMRLEKPGTREQALLQLRAASGKTAVFHTAVALLNSATGNLQAAVVHTRVSFRRLSEQEIVRYVDREPAFDCAGSAKAEGLGIALMETIECDDPTALIGLPLIALCGMLRNEGLSIP
jgi:septum formation protein